MKIKRIDPPSWFAGMRDTTLQLLIAGEDMCDTAITVCHPGAKIVETTITGNGGYVFLYLDIGGCEAGTMRIEMRKGNNTATIPYTLHERATQPEWRRSLTPKDVIYLLMPDRFARHENKAKAEPELHPCPGQWQGGNIEGIRRHLPYLADLGVTALWLTPVLQNNMPETDNRSSYHGYAVTDHYAIDPHFGSMEDYRRLVRDAHKRGLKVVMDFIFNHCGIAHPWLENPPEADWINHLNGQRMQTNYRLTTTVDPYAADVDRQQTVEGWFVDTMPDLNLRNRNLSRYLTQCTIWWIETAGIDAIRMDTFPYADAAAMQQWLGILHKEYPDFKVIGETWVSHPAFSAKWQEGELDCSMDFALFEALNKTKDEESDEWWSGMNHVYNVLCYDYLYKVPSMTLAFIDNHDVNRFLGDFDTYDSKRRKHLVACMKCALAVLLTIPRLPQIYYGTEILMYGTTAVSDAMVRQPFAGGFADKSHNAFTAKGRTKEQNSMYNWLRRLLQWRKSNDITAYGSTRQFIPKDGIYVVARMHRQGNIMTIVNGSNRNAVFRPEHYSEITGNASTARDITTGRSFSLTRPTTMAPRRVAIIYFVRND